jgi:hypothetical protein
MRVSTFLTDPDNKYNRSLLEPYEVILFIIAVIGICFDQYWMVFLFMIIIIFFRDFFRKKEFQRKGAGRTLTESLIFDTDKILIGSQKFDLNSLNKLTIRIWNYDGERYTPLGRGNQIQKGIDNTLEFEVNGNKYKFTFYLQSELIKTELGNLFKTWYRNGIVFQEFDRTGKTYGLQQLNYKQIQEFKRLIVENKV